MTRVYVIGPDDGPYKVGRAKDPTSRLRALQTGNPVSLSILHSVDVSDANTVESTVHDVLRDHRMSGEWFSADLETIKASIGMVAGDKMAGCRNLDDMSSIEREVTDIMITIEDMPRDECLSDAIAFLGRARECIMKHVKAKAIDRDKQSVTLTRKHNGRT